MATQPPPESIILSSFNGLKNTVGSERLGPGDLERAINIDLDDVGQPRRRRGYTLKVPGVWHSLKTVGDKAFGVKDGMLSIIRPNYTTVPLASVGPNRVCYTQVNEEVYFSSANAAGVIGADEVLRAWGATNGQGEWLSPVRTPTATLGAVAGKLLGDPPRASEIEAYKGRVYLAHGKTLWATELYLYNYVDRTKNYMQFEHDITMLAAMDDGLYVGTAGGLYFIKGVLGQFQLSIVIGGAVLPGSSTVVAADLVHPNARQSPMPTGQAIIMMTTEGVVAGFDGGTCYNLTQSQVVFPEGVSAAGLFRQDSGGNAYIAAVDSAGGPAANARIGDYVDAEIRRFGGA